MSRNPLFLATAIEAVVRAGAAQMARFVWAVVHGVAMLGIDGQLPEPGGVEELMRYALERLHTGIDAAARAGVRKNAQPFAGA